MNNFAEVGMVVTLKKVFVFAGKGESCNRKAHFKRQIGLNSLILAYRCSVFLQVSRIIGILFLNNT